MPRPSSDQPGRRAGTRPMCRPYSVLHPVGFAVPETLPPPRCALAAPFRPYPSEGGRCPFCGTVPDPPSPRRWWDRRVLPGTAVPWSPDFPRWRHVSTAAARPSGEVDIVFSCPGRKVVCSRPYCGRGSKRLRSLARHSPSTIPSIKSGRNRRWNAMTAFCGSVTS